MSEDSAARESAYGNLVKRVDMFESETNSGIILAKIARGILDSFARAVTESSEEILEIVRELLPPANSFFSKEFFSAPLMPVANLRRVLTFYNADPGTSDFFNTLKLNQEIRSQRRVMDLVFICCLFQLSTNDSYEVLRNYGSACSLTQSMQPQSDRGSISSELSGNNEVSRRLDAQEAQLNAII